MQAQRVAPEDLVCKDKFLVQSTLVDEEITIEDVTASLFVKDGVRYEEETSHRKEQKWCLDQEHVQREWWLTLITTCSTALPQSSQRSFSMVRR
ncbi:hypothetical protein RYX36_031618 [Vicia faba]